jgi:ABC-2 type transport system ATP-binding protein/lipopolysaccharide transport system ATP-binding protein
VAGNAIEVERLSKRYRLGEDRPGRSLREVLATSARRITGRAEPRSREELWALRDIDFAVAEGESIGVIGRNGAGKSTLLKILSRITEPTTGVARMRGRVAALLEVGTGFHPELTGRENVYLNGAILGMTRRDITRRFDDIIAFAGVERFVETPVKRYSSGMYLRLAFAVAAHLEPDILVVDEVLAVGDAEFQSKCLRRMESVEQEGRTVVFVSHNLEAINRLCKQTVWLDGGRIASVGPAHEVIDAYLGAQVSRDFAAKEQQEGPIALEDVTVTDLVGRPLDVFRRDRPFLLEMRYTIRAPVPGLDLTAALVNARGVEVLNEHWSDTCSERIGDPGRYVARLEVPAILNAGDYVVAVWFGTAYETFIWEAAVRRFRLEGDVKTRPHRAIALGLPWQVEPSDEAPRPPTPRDGSASEWAPHPDRDFE